MKEVFNAKEGEMQKEASKRANIQGKCLSTGKMFATKAFHEGKVGLKKP